MLNNRDDLSTKLIHFTRESAHGADDAWKILKNILHTNTLKGGTGMIKGGYKCICFTEAPISKIGLIISSRKKTEVKYEPFGLIFDKKKLFKHGARPVIYQPLEEFDVLPEEIRYRHVTFNLNDDNFSDFTWEREWRLKADHLKFTNGEVTIVVPNRNFIDLLSSEHAKEVDAFASRNDDGSLNSPSFPYSILTLADLGFNIDSKFG